MDNRKQRELASLIEKNIKSGKVVFHNDSKIEWLKADKENCIEYLRVSISNYEPQKFILALRDVIEASGGMAEIAKKAELGRENLYKSLSGNKKPYFETIIKILQALDLPIHEIIPAY